MLSIHVYPVFVEVLLRHLGQVVPQPDMQKDCALAKKRQSLQVQGNPSIDI